MSDTSSCSSECSCGSDSSAGLDGPKTPSGLPIPRTDRGALVLNVYRFGSEYPLMDLLWLLDQPNTFGRCSTDEFADAICKMLALKGFASPGLCNRLLQTWSRRLDVSWVTMILTVLMNPNSITALPPDEAAEVYLTLREHSMEAVEQWEARVKAVFSCVAEQQRRVAV